MDKKDHYPRFRQGDKVKRIIDPDAKVYEVGEIVIIFQNADDPSKFAYSMKIASGRVDPVDPDLVEHIDPMMEQIVFRINALMSDARVVFPQSGWPDNNLDLGKLMSHLEGLRRVTNSFNAMHEEIMWYVALRNEFIST